MKRNHVTIDVYNHGGRLLSSGIALVIGKHPKHRPYVNITDATGALLVSIDYKVMNELVKKWVKAWGGYPT